MKQLLLLLATVLLALAPISIAEAKYKKVATVSYYGKKFHNRTTASGAPFNMHAMTAAHKTLPFGTRVTFYYPKTKKSVTVKITDRGPYIKGRHFDLSKGAARKLGMVKTGVAQLQYKIIKR